MLGKKKDERCFICDRLEADGNDFPLRSLWHRLFRILALCTHWFPHASNLSSSAVQLLQIPLGFTARPILSFVFPPPLFISLSLLLFGKRRSQAQAISPASDDLSLGKHQQENFDCCNEMSCCVTFTVFIFQEDDFARVRGYWAAGGL